MGASEQIEVVPGPRLGVARTGHLVALKLLARDDDVRPQDAADLRALVLVADAEDLSLASEAVELIADRGYSRGRDLSGALRDLLDRRAGGSAPIASG